MEKECSNSGLGKKMELVAWVPLYQLQSYNKKMAAAKN